MTPPKVFFLDDEDYANNNTVSYWVIVSSLPDHKFVYRLNNNWSSEFKRSRVDHITLKKGYEFHHAMYSWFDEISERDWYLLVNKGYTIPTLDSNSLFQEELQSMLLPTKTKADFILLSDDCLEKQETLYVEETIRKTAGTMNISSYEPHTESVKEALQIELLKSNT